MAGKELGAQGRGVSSAKNSESCVYTLHFAHSAHLLTRISFAFFSECRAAYYAKVVIITRVT